MEHISQRILQNISIKKTKTILTLTLGPVICRSFIPAAIPSAIMEGWSTPVHLDHFSNQNPINPFGIED